MVLSLPEQFDTFLGGGRGGGKSYTLAVLAMTHRDRYRDRARILYLRKTYKGLSDFELICRDLFAKAYNGGATYNSTEHVWKFKDGGYMELGQLESAADYAKYQGRSFTLLLADEAGQYADPAALDIIRSNMRGPADMPLRMVMAANPGDVGHHWLAKRYVFKSAPWEPFLEPMSKRQWVYCPSTFVENNFIDQAEYRSSLESSCPTDKEMLRAWIDGDWTIARGAYFADVLDESRNVIDWDDIPDSMRDGHDARGNYYSGWDLFLAHDFGSTRPSVTYVAAESPGANGPDGRFYPKGSIVLVDELATNKPGQLNEGRGWTVPTLAEEIKTMCKRWRIRRIDGVADDACWSNQGHSSGTIAEEFGRCGIYFEPAKKGNRVDGWTTMKRMLLDAGKPDVPGLYISRKCEYFWATVPYIARDKKRIEDADTEGPDHAADAARYGCRRVKYTVSVEPLRF
jgi:hypothetical protein